MGTYGRLGTGEESDQLVPVLAGVTKVQMMTVSCGAFHTSAVSLEGECTFLAEDSMENSEMRVKKTVFCPEGDGKRHSQ